MDDSIPDAPSAARPAQAASGPAGAATGVWRSEPDGRPAASDPAPTCFRFIGRSVSVDPTDDGLTRELALLLGLSAGRGCGDRHIACERDGAHTVVRTGTSTQICASRDDLLAVLAATVPSLLLDQPGWYELHAGALVVGDEAHLFLGPSYSGKSTLALEAWLGRQQVLGDDYLLVEGASGLLVGVPKPLKIRLAELVLPARLGARLPDGGYVLAQLDGGPCLVLGRGLAGIAAAGRRYRIGSLHILSRAGGRCRTRKRPATRHEAIGALLAQTFTGSHSSLGVVHAFAALLRERRAFVLEVGEHDHAGALAALLA